MENVTLGYAKRPELTEGNLERNQALEVKKGDTLKIYKYNEATVNGIHAYDSIETCKVLAIRKGKDSRRVKIQNLDLNYECTLLIDKSQCKIEIIKEGTTVEEIEVIETIEQPKTTSLVEELKTESQQVINSINTETLETQKESLKAVSNQLDKVYQVIEKNINNEEIRLKLRDIENELKWHYSSLDEMVGETEDLTVLDLTGVNFNNINELIPFISNWNKLPQNVQESILKANNFYLFGSSLMLYIERQAIAEGFITQIKGNKIVINSIGFKDGLQWNEYDQDQQPIVIKNLII